MESVSIQKTVSNPDFALDPNEIWNCKVAKLWKRYRFWCQNGLIITIAFATIITAIVHQVQYPDALSIFNMTYIWGIGLALILISTLSMFIFYFRPTSCFYIISSDNKFRLLTVMTTILILLTLMLINELTEQKWKIIFGLLSCLDLIVLMVISFGFGYNFYKQLIRIRYKKFFYSIYIISYITTNICTFYIVFNNVFHLGASQYINDDNIDWSDSKLWLFCVFPFIWIMCAQLFNNEYAKFKRDKEQQLTGLHDVKQFGTTVKSLYYFIKMVNITSFSTLVIYFIYLLYLDDKDFYNYFIIIYMFFTLIIFINSCVGLHILGINSRYNDSVQNTIVDMYQRF